jgi:hypothetical protein
MRNMNARREADTFFDMASGKAGRGYGFEINSLDLIVRHAALSDACDDSITPHREDWDDTPDPASCSIHLTPSERDELDQLTDLIGQLEGSEEWAHGCRLVEDNDFEEHAREKASEDHQAGPDLDDWPYSCIDWTSAVYEMQDDYIEGSVEAGTWWIKN